MYIYNSVKFFDIFDKNSTLCYKYHMLSIAQATEQLIAESLLLEESLSLGILNLTSLARLMKVELEKRLMKPVKVGSIVMSLKRMHKKIHQPSNKYQDLFNQIHDISVRSNLVEYTYKNAPDIMEKIAWFLKQLEPQNTLFFTTMRGIHETSCIISKSVQKEFEQLFSQNRFLAKVDNLSAITIIHPKEAIFIPGFYYMILKILAWNNINIIETISTFSEFTVILESQSVDKAFSVIKRLIKS